MDKNQEIDARINKECRQAAAFLATVIVAEIVICIGTFLFVYIGGG